MNNSSNRLVLPWVLAPCLCVISSAVICAETARQTQPGEITNTIGMKLKLIPAGEFMMGGTEIGRRGDQGVPRLPPASGTTSRTNIPDIACGSPSLLLGEYEVTVGQFRRFTEASGYKTEAERDGTGGWGYNPEIGKCEGGDPSSIGTTPASRRPTTIRY